MTPAEWAIVLTLGAILGSITAWGLTVQGVLLDIRTELRRANARKEKD